MQETKTLTRYLELKSQIAGLQDELDQLKPLVYDLITAEGASANAPEDRLVYAGFEFQAHIRRTFEYSETEDLQRRIRKRKRIEEKQGVAVPIKATGYVRVVEAEDALPFPCIR